MASETASNDMNEMSIFDENVKTTIEASTDRHKKRAAPSTPSIWVLNNDKLKASDVQKTNGDNGTEAAGVNYAKISGRQMIGLEVKIWWPHDEAFHRGKIIDFIDEGSLHVVQHGNGSLEFLNLSEECWAWKLAKENNSGASPSNATLRSVEISSSHTSKRKKMEVMTDGGKGKNIVMPELHSDEVQAIHQETALAASKMCACDKLVDVNKYKVKASFAPILQSIFAKYGDIARHCSFKHLNVRSTFLDMVCNVVQKLRSAEFGISSADLTWMISDISEAAGANLQVCWLQDFLEGINQVEEVGVNSPRILELRATSRRLVKSAKRDMEDRKQEFERAEKRWNALKCLNESFETYALNFLAKKQAWRARVDELV